MHKRVTLSSGSTVAYILLFSNLHYPCIIRQCVCGKKRRTKGSVVQELCHYVILSIMTDSAYFVKSTPLGAFSVSFLIFCRHVTDIQKMCTKDFKTKKN